MSGFDERIDLLRRALAAYAELRRGEESPDDYLARHPELRELLEPMLRGEADPAGMAPDPEGEATPAPGPAPEPAARGAAATTAAIDVRVGDSVGPYRILEELGSGGMGTVFLAEQRSPIQRRVALKVVKHGMDTRQVVARFESERQALALMNHPNIARVFDGGATPSGRPYFAMELVPGVAITTYCDRERLTTRERLDLFLAVTDAIEHAHQKGVIHRDLKPSNVLVTTTDGPPRPKIIDFGIAKATGGRLTDLTLHTETGQLIGTPEYMSPEQARSSGLDVDTRSDIWSAGVLLYELLVGVVPVDARRDPTTGYQGILRAICDSEPVRPSTRITRHDADTSEVAVRRRTDARALRRELAGDLDQVVMKALEKDRNRRYATMTEFADDLRRYLAHEPVRARPPSLGYRLRKFVRRHRVQVAAGAIVLLSLVGGLVASLTSASRARTARALEAERAEEARRVTDFLVDVFEQVDPGRSAGEDVPVRHVLDSASRRIATELHDQPGVRARLLATMGRVFLALGSFERAEAELRAAIHAAERVPHPDDVERVRWLVSLGNTLEARGRYREALATFESARAQLRGDWPDAERIDRTARTGIGTTLSLLGRHAEAERSLRSLLDDALAAGAAEVEVESIELMLASALHNAGRHSEARAGFDRVIASHARLWPDGSPRTIVALVNLSHTALRLGDSDAAAQALERALAMSERIHPERHPTTAAVHDALAELLQRTGRASDAEPHLLEALAIRERMLHHEHPRLAEVLNDLGTYYLTRDSAQRALPFLARALDIYRASFEGDHAFLAIAMCNHANALLQAGSPAPALPLADEAVAMLRRLGDARLAWAIVRRADVLVDLGRHAEAETAALEARAMYEASTPGDLEIAWIDCLLARLSNLRGAHAPAEEFATRALRELDGTGAGVHLYAALARFHVAWSKQGRGDAAAAVTHAEASVQMFEQVAPHGHPLAAFALDLLGRLRLADANAAAIAAFERALEIRRRHLPEAAHFRVQSLHNLAAAYAIGGQADRARPLFDEAVRLRRGHARRPDADLAASLYFAARLALTAGDDERAIALAEECLGHQRELGARQPAEQTSCLIAKALARLGRHERAEQVLAAALADADARPSVELLRSLVDLHESAGRPQRAAEYRRMLETR